MEFVKVIFSVSIVIFVVVAAYFTTRWLASKQNSFGSGKMIQAFEKVMLGKDSFLAVVKVDAKVYLMSISGTNTELVTELEPEIIDKYSTSTQTTPDFKKILDSVVVGKSKIEEKFNIGRNKKG